MSSAKIIKYLRKQIPVFECVPGCSDCCGITVFSKWEWAQISDKCIATSIHCPYIIEKGCAIYPQRPIMCRLFGTVSKMKCPYGRGPVKLLTPKKEKELMALYLKVLQAD